MKVSIHLSNKLGELATECYRACIGETLTIRVLVNTRKTACLTNQRLIGLRPEHVDNRVVLAHEIAHLQHSNHGESHTMLTKILYRWLKENEGLSLKGW